MKKPIFFVSSTIFDFGDLRGAIKYQLESLGNVVLASEFNDFKKPLDVHSYEACLASIEQCDYFILLIGSRVGGWYDATNRISITQQEYRRAYELQQQGRLRIITFVRSEVWQARESQKELEKHLEQLGLADELKRSISGYPNKFASDARFIISFIEEVGRNAETRDAIRTGGTLPKGNWIHIFRDFSDVMSVLRTLLFAGLPSEEAAHRKLLQNELTSILQATLWKKDGVVGSPKAAIQRFSMAAQITAELHESSKVRVPAKEWDQFCVLIIHLLGVRLNALFLESALRSPLLLDFDGQEGTYRETEAYKLLGALMDEVRSFNSANSAETLSLILSLTPRSHPPKPAEVTLNAMRLSRLIFLSYRWANIVELASALLHILDGKANHPLALLPFSPIAGMDEQIIKERVRREDVAAFLSSATSPSPGA